MSPKVVSVITIFKGVVLFAVTSLPDAAKRRTSSSTIRPVGPPGVTDEISTPSSLASLLARGDAGGPSLRAEGDPLLPSRETELDVSGFGDAAAPGWFGGVAGCVGATVSPLPARSM